jgi:hypothetical protein
MGGGGGGGEGEGKGGREGDGRGGEERGAGRREGGGFARVCLSCVWGFTLCLCSVQVFLA